MKRTFEELRELYKLEVEKGYEQNISNLYFPVKKPVTYVYETTYNYIKDQTKKYLHYDFVDSDLNNCFFTYSKDIESCYKDFINYGIFVHTNFFDEMFTPISESIVDSNELGITGEYLTNLYYMDKKKFFTKELPILLGGYENVINFIKDYIIECELYNGSCVFSVYYKEPVEELIDCFLLRDDAVSFVKEKENKYINRHYNIETRDVLKGAQLDIIVDMLLEE